jgi:hypothetical protein
MNFREAGLYTNRSTLELRTEFEDILEAMEAIGRPKAEGITVNLIDFWLNGSTLLNYTAYMVLLNAHEPLIKAGLPRELTTMAINENCPIDRYVLFKNACLHFMGEELTDDFKTLVVDPLIKMYAEPSKKAQESKNNQLGTARKAIKAITPNIRKTIAELNKIQPHIIAGTFEESIFIKLQQIEDLIVNQLIEE